MYSKKIHSQSSSGLGTSEPRLGEGFETRLSVGPNHRLNSYEWAKGASGRSFDVVLFQELQRLKKREESLRQSVAQKNPSPSQVLDYKSLAHSTKLLEILFTHMERACQSIVANFR